MTTTLLERPVAAPSRLRWLPLVTLHLVPAAVTFAGALIIAPQLIRVGWPEWSALTLSFLLLLIPIELGILLRAVHRTTGRWSLSPAFSHSRPPRWWTHLLATPALLAFALLMLALNTPVEERLAGWAFSPYPDWLLPSTDFPIWILLTVLLVTLVVDGFLNPIVEELYFKASSALFSASRYWQPENFLFIFLVQILITFLVVKLSTAWLGAAVHAIATTSGVLSALLT